MNLVWRGLAERRVEGNIGGFFARHPRGNVTPALTFGARARALAGDLARQFVERSLQTLGTKRFANARDKIGRTRRRLARFVTCALGSLFGGFGRSVSGLVSR